MPRSFKKMLKPTKFEDLDPRTQEFIKEKGLKKKSSSKKNPDNIIKMEKSLENLMKDERFPKRKKPPTEMEKRQPPNKPSRVPGEQKEMQPLSKGGRAGFKSGSKGCKLAMKGKGRAYGKNS